MTKTPRLNDLQLILLANAAARENGSLIPLSDTLVSEQSRVGRAIAALIKRRLIEETRVTDPNLAFREQDDTLIGLFITEAGRAAIGADEEPAASQGSDLTAGGCEAKAPPARASTKAALVLSLLRRCEGATIDELTAATDWLPHTTRAHLTGLRKKGHAVTRSKRGDATCYSIAAEA